MDNQKWHIQITAGGSRQIRFTGAGSAADTVPLFVTVSDSSGRETDLTGAKITARALDPEIAALDENRNMIPYSADPVQGSSAAFAVSVALADGTYAETVLRLPVVKAKTRASYMTAEKAAAARENMARYPWAREETAEVIAQAELFSAHLEQLYAMITSNGVPRGAVVGQRGDPDAYHCRYCGVDIRRDFGAYSWLHDPLRHPWKVQCPACRRRFPTNDFGSFYQLGLNAYGEFDRERALEAHAKRFGDPIAEPGSPAYYGYGVKGGYLTNETYEDLEQVDTLNVGKGLRPGECTATWGVDDGLGYVPQKPDGTPYTFPNGVTERHGYIAEYMHNGIWRKISNSGVVSEAVKQCAEAYFYTGERRFGRVAAILLDRIADFYPDYDTGVYGDMFLNSDGGTYTGKAIGCIWETGNARDLMTAYDMVFDVYDDPFVVDYIRSKAAVWKMRHAKQTPNQIRTNVEDGLLRTALEGLKDCSVSGNFGFPQIPNARGAVILDSMPETKQWLDYLLAPGWSRLPPCRGGGIDETLVNIIDADGQGDEASSYNVGWLTSLIRVNEALVGYTPYSAANLYSNPKFIRMLYANIPLIAGNYTPAIGDSGYTAGIGHWMKREIAQDAWKNLRDPVFAQILYLLNGNTVQGLRYDITEAEPGRLAEEVQAVIGSRGILRLNTEVMTNFGFGILWDGEEQAQKDTRRNLWMYFGSNGGHGHRDTLNLGMTAYGLNFMPELGYPEQTGPQPNRLQWIGGVLSHNTVMVDGQNQKMNGEIRGNLLHFDDSGAVQLLDVDASYVYPSTTQYRRSVILVRIDAERSYAVDLFRVRGGNSHLYSFHAASNAINATEGLALTPQMENGSYQGSYAGIDVPYGPDPNSPNDWHYDTVYPRGYTWLKNVDRCPAPEAAATVDFAIRDFHAVTADPKGLGLRMTILGADAADRKTEVAIADGLPPQKAENQSIDRLKYVLVKHTGEALDTTFTTVFEPYRDRHHIVSAELLTVTAADGAERAGDAHRAVKVTHGGGRVDYIFYSTNSAVTYCVKDGVQSILFRGFVGVYTVENGENTYSYVHDGDIIGSFTEGKPAILGTVKDFTKENALHNEIVMMPKEPLTDTELAALAGKCLLAENAGNTRGGAFRIRKAERRGGDIAIAVGGVTAIRSYAEEGYRYTIAEGQHVRIPLTACQPGRFA